jgi:membrane associated rhomboid family serine protease
MFALYMFGSAIEQVFGARRYLVFYFVAVVSAAITQLIVAVLLHGVYPTIGASGGVFGLLLAYAMYFPRNRVMLLFPPVPMSARTFVVVYAVIELLLGVTNTQSSVAHFAHLGGMVGGYLLLRFWRGGIRRPSR